MTQRVAYIALQQFGNYEARPLTLLREAGFEVRQNTFGRRIQRHELPEALRDADAVLAGVEPYDAALLAALPRLRCISRCGVGTDAIDLDAARLHDIAVLTTADEVVEPVAEMTMAMILALARQLPLHGRDASVGRWVKRTGVLLSEWTIGLVGFGRIGRAVERLLRAFGPRVLVVDPAVASGNLPAGVELRPLDALLAESDVVSLHAGSRREAGALIGRRELGLMKRGSYLVNTARGYLLDETALYEALMSGHVSAAALDVFEREPYSGPLARLPQVLCTPHVSTLTRASRIAMELRCAQNVVEFFEQHASPIATGRTHR